MRIASGWPLLAALLTSPAAAQAPLETFKIFQFPADAIPRIDGDASDWKMVPDDYVIGTDKLMADDDSGRHPDAKSIDVRVRVGWVKGLNRLYFLYEADDDHWDFAHLGLQGDIFELVVDGDRSGGPLIARFHPKLASRPGAAPDSLAISDEDAWWHFQNVHAQNYHIFTPPGERDWAMAWGPQAWWIKRLPYANAAYRYDFEPGQRGRLTLEFWITPFDYASADGPEHSVETQLSENKLIGLSWAVIDRDGSEKRGGFWNLSREHKMFGDASLLRAFRLMPLEPTLAPKLQADWSFQILDRQRRVVAFHDDSRGEVTARKWDFGDGQSSTEPNPVHVYSASGKYVVVLAVSGAAGTSRLSKVWDVSFEADPRK